MILKLNIISKYMDNKSIKERVCLRFNSSENITGDSIMDLEMSFDNPTDDILMYRINTWLKAIGRKYMKVSIKLN